jgi:hypothetical protein
MKKITVIIVALFASVAVKAQDTQRPYNMFYDRQLMNDLVRTVSVLSVFLLIAIVLITLVRKRLDFVLKSKMIDKGVSESLAAQFLDTSKKNNKTVTIKWFTILCGIGTGLALIQMFQPYGVHSLTIMVFCIAASFLGFYFYLKQSGE